MVPVVHHDGGLRATLRRGLPRRGYRVVACRSVERARAMLQRELVDAIVVDVAAGWAEATFQLIEAFPRIPVFALSAFRPDDGELVLECGRRGVRGILVEGVDDPAAGEVIAAASASRARRAALSDAPRLLRLTEPLQQRAWDEVQRQAGSPVTTAQIARALKHTREHLSREFAAGGAPNLKRVIDLARATWAADLLGNPAYTVATVARILGYSSPGHLGGSARRVAGVSARELGSLGPRGVLQRFLRGRTRSRL